MVAEWVGQRVMMVSSGSQYCGMCVRSSAAQAGPGLPWCAALPDSWMGRCR